MCCAYLAVTQSEGYVRLSHAGYMQQYTDADVSIRTSSTRVMQNTAATCNIYLNIEKNKNMA